MTNIQGFVECKTFGSLGQQEGVVALTARRSRLHPGTRYLARGINSCYSTGNVSVISSIFDVLAFLFVFENVSC